MHSESDYQLYQWLSADSWKQPCLGHDRRSPYPSSNAVYDQLGTSQTLRVSYGAFQSDLGCVGGGDVRGSLGAESIPKLAFLRNLQNLQ